MIESEGVDAICRGEADEALVEFVNVLEAGGDITQIRNFWIKKEGTVHRNPLRPLIQDLDSLPFVDRDILAKYPSYRHYGVRFFLGSRGCPYNCSYCFNHALQNLYKEAGGGPYIRQRSVPHVIEEIRRVKKDLKTKRVYFYDDIFILNKPWIREFTEAYGKEFDIPFTCYLRVNLVTEELIANLAGAGCSSVAMAIESGNPEIRENVLRRKMTNRDIEEAARLLHKYRICFMTQNMVGLPDETIDNAYETVELNARIRPGYAWCSIFQPYPGTDAYRYCIEKGYLSPDHKQDISYQREAPIKKQDKRLFENLHKILGLMAEFPSLIRFSRTLIKWPVTPLLSVAYRGFKGYTHFWRMNMSAFDLGFFLYIYRRILYVIRSKLMRAFW